MERPWWQTTRTVKQGSSSAPATMRAQIFHGSLWAVADEPRPVQVVLPLGLSLIAGTLLASAVALRKRERSRSHGLPWPPHIGMLVRVDRGRLRTLREKVGATHA
jgi:hypothetical protein